MADENSENEAAGGGRKRLLPVAVAAVAALLVGGLAGAFVAGPLLAKRTAPPATAAAPAPAEEGEEEDAGAPADGAAYPIHTVENLILNPAGSGGTRFLMLTVALELKDEAAAEEMKRRDPELRDILLRVLGARTVEQLADVTAREALKGELRDSASAAFPRQAVRRLYLPQFVIQ